MRRLFSVLVFLAISSFAAAQNPAPCTALPAGIVASFNGATATFTGTPTTVQVCSFSVKACDSADPSNCASVTQTVTINAAPQPVTITGTPLPNGQIKQPYSAPLTCSSPSGSCNWTIGPPSGTAAPAASSATN